MKLMIVEDSVLVSQRLNAALADIPHLETTVVRTCGGALAAFSQSLPEWVVLDIQLPDGNGIEVLRAIKDARPLTQVLMFTSHSGHRQHCERQGADGFFDKAMDFDALVGTIRTGAEESHGQL